MANLLWLLLLFLERVAAAQQAPTTDANMNGEYRLAPTPNAKGGNWSTSFKDYPGGVESFTLYAGPVTSTYGEVFWTALPHAQLPQELISRFKGKGMAIVGHEVDQVRRGAGPNGEDVSVPINVAYNHHYGSTLLGEGSRIERVPYDPSDPRTSLLSPEPGWDFIPVEHTPSPNGLPTSLWNGYSNGGEYRKSYHGLAPPFVQVIESPTHLAMTPMQIGDHTWNRDKMNLTGGAFVPGPYPKKGSAGKWPVGSDGSTKWPSGSLAPTENGYPASGLLECPLTTRIRKQLTGGGWNASFVATIGQPSCLHELAEGSEVCFAAAKRLGISESARVSNEQGASAELPSGCSVQVNGTDVLVFFNTNADSTSSCGSGTDMVEGVQQSLVDLGLSLSSSRGANITMSGPADSWFGIGFNTDVMTNSPYAIVIDGNGTVTEHVLGDHAAGIILNNSVQIISHAVTNGTRTVTLSRPLAGLTPQHHTFETTKLSLDFISAVGSSPTFGYHKSKTVATIALWPTTPGPAPAAACVCSVPAAPFGAGTGTIKYLPTGEEIGFPPRCEPYPRETVLRDQNPTCDIRTYVGGLSTCHHGWHLLDADQEVPWKDQPLTYHFKWRFYFQEYDPSRHVSAYGWNTGIGGNTAEYDVPKCPAGTPVEKCTHEISGVVTPPGKNMHFVAAHYHCHAPTCLRMEIYNNNTGELLCSEEAYHGQGGTDNDRFDEFGYIAQRICLWGNSTYGLDDPPMVSGVPLLIKAVTNSTFGHHGEMALPQMLVADL